MQNEKIAQVDSAKAITRRIGKPRPGTIPLWTIQPLAVWHSLCQQETLYVDATHPKFLDSIDDFREGYEWMRQQMAQRIPGYEGYYPWWAYDYKLDLRSWRYQTYPPYMRYVRLALAIPQEKVLLSAYGDWHFVLNRWYLPYATDGDEAMQELDAWDAEASQQGADVFSRQLLPEPWESQLRASWERIFDVDRLRATNTIQATFERLELADVLKVTEFVSQPKK